MSFRSRKRLFKQIKLFWFFCVFAVAALLGSAVYQMNSYIHLSSALADAKKQTAGLSEKNSALELKLSQLNSVNNFNDYARSLAGDFQKVDVASVRFVSVPAARLAQK